MDTAALNAMQSQGNPDGGFSKRGYPRDPRGYIGIIEGLWGSLLGNI